MVEKETMKLEEVVVEEAIAKEEELKKAQAGYPRLCLWELFFEVENGFDNRERVMREVVRFLNDDEADSLKLSGKCLLGGEVYGHENFSRGEGIFTSPVVSIEKVTKGYCFDKKHDMLCAKTKSGSRYYFYSDNRNGFMNCMLTDTMKHGRPSKRHGKYLPKKLWKEYFL